MAMISFMAVLPAVSLFLIVLIVNRSLAPMRSLARTVHDIARGEKINDEIPVTRNDEVGEMQKALESLRLNRLIALQHLKK